MTNDSAVLVSVDESGLMAVYRWLLSLDADEPPSEDDAGTTRRDDAEAQRDDTPHAELAA